MIICSHSNIDIIQGVIGYGDAEGITDWRLENTGAGVFNIQNSSSISIITPSGGTTEIGQIANSIDRYMIFKEGTSTFTVPSGGIVCDILIVGGGGAGGAFGGGGGAGQVLYGTNVFINSGTVNINVGNGGATTTGLNVSQNGFSSSITIGGITYSSVGGGGGGGRNSANFAVLVNGNNGGSGGGGNTPDGTSAAIGGLGGSSTKTSYSGWISYGNSGGYGCVGDTHLGGGGGGAGGVGGSVTLPSTSGAGGIGVDFSSIFGTSVGASGWFGGGGGGCIYGTGSGGLGGTGGGGKGGQWSPNTPNGVAGTVNTGGGGGASGLTSGYGYGTGGAGGSGIVIIRYSIANISIIDNGNVGIGTTPITSSSKLEIYGDINISGNYKLNNRDVINDTSNYVLSTSNTLVPRILTEVGNGSNYISRLTTALNTRVDNTSNYMLSTNSILSNRISSRWTNVSPGINYSPTITSLPSATTIGTTGNYTYMIFAYTTETAGSGSGQTQYTLNMPTGGVNCDILIVGGGGGGGKTDSGGGGAGGLIYIQNTTLTGDYTIKVGKGGLGGASGASVGIVGAKGSNTSFIGTNANYIAYGGGGGGYATVEPSNLGPYGSSGGLGSGDITRETFNVHTIGQGYPGGLGTTSAGGGGGSGGAGVNSGNGGIGTQVSITGTNLYYAGGGGGGHNPSGTTGGLGGGGSATYLIGNNATYYGGGGGGGGGGFGNGGNGFEGIVILRFLSSAANVGANVGIGTTNPVSKLHIYDDTISNTKLTIQNNFVTGSITATPATTSINGNYTQMVFTYTTDNTGAGQTQYTITVPAGGVVCDVLIVAGGGGGGMNAGAGGGAGGLILLQSTTLAAGNITIRVGDGGNGGTTNAVGTVASNGKNSIFGSYTAIGGGAGVNSGGANGNAGGSGGGAGDDYSGNRTGGAGTAGQGFKGGDGTVPGGGTRTGGGGGGAGGEGQASVSTTRAGDGGIGRNLSSIFGTSVGQSGWFAGGGGGGVHNGTGGTGGTGGGGSENVDGTNGTGGGGGAGRSPNVGRKGGSGIVIIRFVSSPASSAIELLRGNSTDSNIDYKIGNYLGEFKIISSTSSVDTDYIRITTDGASIYNPTGSPQWSTVSDRRIKENIEKASYDKCYDNINKLELYRFNYIKELKNINKDLKQLGYIAQEVQDIFPKAVSMQEFHNDNLSIPDMLSIDIAQINYSLYGAVKKLIEIDNDKELRIKKIENLLNSSNIDISSSNIDISSSNIDISSSNIDISSSNIDISSSNIDTSSSNVIDISSSNIDTSSSNVIDISSSNVDISSSNITDYSSNITDYSSNIDTSSSNI